MSLTILIMLFVLFLALVLIVVGPALFRKNSFNKLTFLGISSLFLQLLLLVLFFSDILPRFNEKIVDILWWGTVLYGLIVGIREIRNNIFVSLLNIFFSILLAIIMALMLFITSM